MTQEEIDRLTPEERARLDAAEQEALRRFYNRMNEGRGTPRRHMRLAFFVLFAISALFFVVLGIGYLVSLLL